MIAATFFPLHGQTYTLLRAPREALDLVTEFIELLLNLAMRFICTLSSPSMRAI
jgi:hypothetical protein